MAAEDAKGFADACAALYRDAELWSRVRIAALAKVGHAYSIETFQRSVFRVLDECTESRKS